MLVRSLWSLTKGARLNKECQDPTITCYLLDETESLYLSVAPAAREWMDQTNNHYANRCLPLLIANQHGWVIKNAQECFAIWDGREGTDAVKIYCRTDDAGRPTPASSHFGHGIITFQFRCIFRTSAGYNLWVRGPSNLPKHGAVPLEGIVESDWAVASFTMNWKITAKGIPVSFNVGEPICMLFPIRRGDLERFEPQFCHIRENMELKHAHDAWAESRAEFLADLRDSSSEAFRVKWQKDYVLGQGFGMTPSNHQVKLKVRDFKPRGKNTQGSIG